MDRPVVIRPARIEDSDQIWPLVRDFAISFTPDRTVFDSVINVVLNQAATLVLVAEPPGRRTIVGLPPGLLPHHVPPNGAVAWVEEIMVAESARRAGVGRALMERAEGWGAGSGVAYLALATRRAAEFYLSLGYQESATFFRKRLRAGATSSRPPWAN